MGIVIKQTKPTAPMEPGWYRAKVAELQMVEGKYGEQIQWLFELENGQQLRAWSSAIFNPRSKLYAWTEAILAKKIPESYDFNSDHIIGRRCDILVEIKPTPNGDFARVTKVAPANSMTRDGAVEDDEDLPF